MLIALTSLSCVQSFHSTFINLGFPAIDIGVGSEGDVCVVSTDNYVYCYEFMEDNWTLMATRNIEAINRLDVDDDGTIYVISRCGIYYLDCENRWVKLPGKGTDIGVGTDFTVWKLGDDLYNITRIRPRTKFPNYGVWKLICDCECLCICRRRCIRFRLRFYDPCPGARAPKCYWFRTDGYGINIDVFPNGDAIISVNHWNRRYTTVKTVNHHGMYFRDYQCGGRDFPVLSGDITVGNTGVVYAVEKSGNNSKNGRVWKCHQNRFWRLTFMQGVRFYTGINCTTTLFADRISAGPYNQYWFIYKQATFGSPTCKNLMSFKVYTSSVFDYINGIPKNFTNFIFYKAKEQEAKIRLAQFGPETIIATPKGSVSSKTAVTVDPVVVIKK
jgi:hypothetical protein